MSGRGPGLQTCRATMRLPRPPLLAVALAAFALPGAASATTIGFDELAVGTQVDTEYQSLGATFSGGTRVVALAGTQSPPNALTSRQPGLELDPGGITIAFSAGQPRVKVYVGLDETPGFAGTATLTAYRAGPGGFTFAIDSASATLGPGQDAVTVPLEVEQTDKWAITSVDVVYSAGLQFEVIDGVEFGAAGPPAPADTTPPVVTIAEPLGEPTPTGMVALSGTVLEDVGLASLELSIGPRGGPATTTLPLDWAAGAGTYTFGPSYVGPLAAGWNTIAVRADDLAGNTGEDSADVLFEPPPEGVNLYARGLEVTQVLQTYVLARTETHANPLHDFPPYVYSSAPFPSEALGLTPLVRGKPTVVRLYAGVEGTAGPVEGVPARLYGFRDGVMLPGSPLLALEPTIAVRPGVSLDAQRASAGESWNFLLPPEWTGGSLELRAEVNPLGDAFRVEECAGCNDAANAFAEVRVWFSATGAILIRPYLIEWTRPAGGTSIYTGDFEAVFEDLRPYYPVAPWGLAILHNQGVIASTETTCEGILTDFQAGVWEGSPVSWSEPILKDVAYGILPDIAVSIDAGGCAPLDGRAAIGVGYREWMAPHEIGHTFGLAHASCANQAGADGQPCEADWPWEDGEIGALGFDVERGRVVPSGAYDFMSYGSGEHWVSPLTYARLFERLALRAGSRPAADEAGPFLLVRGRVAEDGSGELESARRVEGPADSLPREGPVALVLLGGDGAELASRPFEPAVGGGGSFLVTLPLVAGVERVELRRGEDVLATLARSGHAPAVRLLEPNGGERWPARGTRTVRWQASDADGDALRFRLQYSADGGATWRTVAAGLSGSSFPLDVAGLEGSAKARLRVLAEDGFDTAGDPSDRAFRVASKGPEVTVLLPAGGDFAAGVDIPLAASALDLEDGQLAGSRLSWRSSADGPIGSGEQVTFRAPSIGAHVVTVRATDRGGLAATAKVTIRVVAAASGDEVAPLLTGLSPEPGAKGVTRTTRVGAMLSEAVAGLCARSFRLVDARGRTVPARIAYDEETGEVSLVPRVRLAAGAAYRVVVSGRVTDLAGNPVRAPRWTFRTA